MNGLNTLVQRAFYLGIGIAAAAGERVNELRIQAQKLADEMVARGEMNAEEARKFVDDLVNRAQNQAVEEAQEDNSSRKPRQIEIVADDEESVNPDNQNVDDLRNQVQSLQEELNRLKNK